MKKFKFKNPNIMTWWDSLSLDEKQFLRANYQEIYDWNIKREGHIFPMPDIEGLRLSQLSEKQISRIKDFKTHTVKEFSKIYKS